MGYFKLIAVIVLSLLLTATVSVVFAAEKSAKSASTPITAPAKKSESPVKAPNISVVKPKGIEILSPHSDDKWPSGEMHELKWRVSGIPVDPKTMVKIRMTSFDWSPPFDIDKEVPMTAMIGTCPITLTTPPGQQGAEYIITASIIDPVTKQKFESTITGIMIGSPFIQIMNLAELTAAPVTPGQADQVLWKLRGSGYGSDLTFAITDAASNYPYLSSTNSGNNGAYEFTAKAFAKKMKFSIIPSKPKVLGASFVFEVGTGKYPSISPAITPPSAPSLKASLIDYKEHVALQWKDTSGNEKEFVVERKRVGASGNYTEIGRVPMNSTSYQDKAIPTAATYRYRIRAINDNGSGASNEVDITTIAKPALPVDLIPVNPRPAKGPAGYCPEGGLNGGIDITIRNLGPGTSGTTNAVLFVTNKQAEGSFEELKSSIPVLKKGESFVWHANASKCMNAKGTECEFNLMINYNPQEIHESDWSTNDIYFTCKKTNLAPIPKVKAKAAN